MNCIICGKEFTPIKSNLKRGGGKFCSRKCMGLGERGKNNHRWKGGTVEKKCVVCGITFTVDICHSLSNPCIFCSRKCKGIWTSENSKGENNPCWRGGSTPKSQLIRTSEKYSTWRTSVFTRDNFTCQKCGQHNGYLHAHHIKEFAKFPMLRFEISNGRTLCRKCHKETHKEIKNGNK